jgi:hypothetical protein
MFGLFKSDPKKKLDKQYHALLEQAMQAQRSGDIRGYSELTEQAHSVHEQLQALEKSENV